MERLTVEISLSAVEKGMNRINFAVVRNSFNELAESSLEARVSLFDEYNRPLTSREYCLIPKEKIVAAYDETTAKESQKKDLTA
jgi:hypothetical protein